MLLAIPFALIAAHERWIAKSSLSVGRTAAILVAPGVVCVAGWLMAAGSVSVVFETMKIVLASPSTNLYAQQFGSGGWFRYPIDELLMAPWPTLLGLGAISVVLLRRLSGASNALELGLVLVYVAQVGVLSFFTKNLRYVAVLEFPLRILAVGLLWECFSAERSRWGRVACVAVVAAMCAVSWFDFRTLWLDLGLYDPVTAALVTMRKMAPGTPP